MSIRVAIRLWELTCPGSVEEISRARRWTRDVLRDCPCVDDAALIVSELATNAITHTLSGENGTFHVALVRIAEVVAISVTDIGGTKTKPHINDAPDDSVNSRGLTLVAALATYLETTGDEHGHTTTAALLLKPDDEATHEHRPSTLLEEQP